MDYGDDNRDRLWKKLTKVAELSLSCVFAESALVGALDARSTARFVAHVGGTLGVGVVYGFLCILYMLQLTAATALCVPAIPPERVSRASILSALTLLSLLESVVHLHSNDFSGFAKGVMMLSTCVIHLVDAFSSRSHARVNGMLDSVGYRDTVDTALGKLRETASRYRFGAHAMFLITGSVLYTCSSAESVFSKSAIRGELAKNQWSKAMSFVALCASIGANDRDTSLYRPTRLGRQKSL